MKTTKLTLTLEVDYDLQGADVDELRTNLRTIAEFAAANGMITGDTEATVETWSASVVNDTESGDTGDNNSPAVIGAWLRSIPSDSHVYIDDDGMRLKVVGDPEPYLELGGHSEEEEEPEMLPLTVSAFVERLETIGEAIDPTEAFREVCLEQDGAEWRRLQDRQTDGEARCKLELDDKPAFRQGLNDYADAMVKDHQWVTFDNGSLYFSADDIKEAVAEFDGMPETYEPTKELKSIIDFWL
jgi:hypothetical protein